MFSSEQFEQTIAEIERELNRPSLCFKCESYVAQKLLQGVDDPENLFGTVRCCPQCMAFVQQERQKLIAHRNMDKPTPRDGFLDLKSWIETIKYFQSRCAYCATKQYEVLDHFLPRTCGGKTTTNNCVPSCIVCNRDKGSLHPDRLDSVFPHTIKQIRIYLANKNS